MTDRELLEKAARAAGINGRYREDWDAIERYDIKDKWGRGEQWRPHRDDGDAFRLMNSMNLSVSVLGGGISRVTSLYMLGDIDERHDVNGSVSAATRRAIIRAAAAMVEDEG